MEISYSNKKVEKYFIDYRQMQKKLPFEWTRTIKKHMDRLLAAECFGDFLKLNLGRPELLKGYVKVHYSLRVTPNVRLILELETSQENIETCKEIKIEGVCDYHDGKENWYIS